MVLASELGCVIEIADIRSRWRKATAFLDERARRLFAANEALAQGRGGVLGDRDCEPGRRATRSTSGIQELRSGRNELGPRLRRRGAGHQECRNAATRIAGGAGSWSRGAIRGDPCSPLRWISRSPASHRQGVDRAGTSKSVSAWSAGKLLRELDYKVAEANCKTQEEEQPSGPRNAQFEHVNATVQQRLPRASRRSR